MKLFTLSIACVLTVLFGVTAEASITMDSTSVRAIAFDSGTLTDQFFFGTTIPTPPNTMVIATNNGITSSNSLDWYLSGSQTTLDIAMDHQRNGNYISFAETIQDLRFTANSDQSYSLAGYYEVTDFGQSGALDLFVQLYDFTDGVLFESRQYSNSSLDEVFSVGGGGGDGPSIYNYTSGSLTGSLITGHQYELQFFANTQAAPDPDAGAHATGHITLNLTEADETAAAPEPLSLMVWVGLIAATVINTGRRIRS